MQITLASWLAHFLPADLKHDLLKPIQCTYFPGYKSGVRDNLVALNIDFPVLGFLPESKPIVTLFDTIDQLRENTDLDKNLALKKTIAEKPGKIKLLLVQVILDVAKYEITIQVNKAIQAVWMPSYSMGMPAMAYLLMARKDLTWLSYSRIDPKLHEPLTKKIQSSPVLFVGLCKYLKLNATQTLKLACKSPYPLQVIETLNIPWTRENRLIVRESLRSTESCETLIRTFLSALTL